MNVTVVGTTGLPNQAYLSVRVGDTKRLRPFRAGEAFSFSKVNDTEKYIQLDVFEQLGSQMVRSVPNAKVDDQASGEVVRDIRIPNEKGVEMSAQLRISPMEAPQQQGQQSQHRPASAGSEKPASSSSSSSDRLGATRHRFAIEAKRYLDTHGVWGNVQGMLHALLKERPQDPLEFMVRYLVDLQRAGMGSRPATAFSFEGSAFYGFGTSFDGSRPATAFSCQTVPENRAFVSCVGSEQSTALPADVAAGPEGKPAPAAGHLHGRSSLPCCKLGIVDEGPAESLSLPTPGVAEEEEEAADGGDTLPDLQENRSLMADVLWNNPTLFDSLRHVDTKLGSTLKGCLQRGFAEADGDSTAPSIGLLAGDEECYTVFNGLFAEVIKKCHGGFDVASMSHPTDMDVSKVAELDIDPTGRYVVSTLVKGSRNVRGIRFPPQCDAGERRDVERLLVHAMLGHGDESSQGVYFPLQGSSSYTPRPGGMSCAEQDSLLRHECLFVEPTDPGLVAAGLATDWPHARGVFATKSCDAAIWCNEADHACILASDSGADLRMTFGRFVKVTRGLEQALSSEGYEFAHHPRLGYLTSCPSKLGTALSVCATLRIPRLASSASKLREMCATFGLNFRQDGCKENCAEISNSARLGRSEVELANTVIEGCARLVLLEQRLEKGEELPAHLGDLALDPPPPVAAWSLDSELGPDDSREEEGLGTSDCPGFPATGDCPEVLDLSCNFTAMAGAFKASPAMYQRLRTLRTRLGVSLSRCIKPGVDVPGHPCMKLLGVRAGDPECYELFRELFDEMVELRHGDWPQDGIHKTDLRPEALLGIPMDPYGKYVLVSKVSSSRNLTGFRMPSAIGFDERRQVEQILCKALLRPQGDGAAEELVGAYHPLRGSMSQTDKPGGMTAAEEDALLAQSFLFHEPDSAVMLSSGMGRHWPDARGVFASQRLCAWVNEEDHLRITSVEPGAGLIEAFARFAATMDNVEKSLLEQGSSFARSDRLGYLCSCPSNIGTGLSVSVALRLPLLSTQANFHIICKELGIQAQRPSPLEEDPIMQEPGVWVVSNTVRLGLTEVESTNTIIRGCSQLVRMEHGIEVAEEFAVKCGSTRRRSRS